MKIAVIGTIVKDRIHYSDGTVVRSLGGLMYSINAFRAVLDENDYLYPVSYVGRDIRDEVFSLFAADNQIRTEGLLSYTGPNNQVDLYYQGGDERTEYSRYPHPPLPYDVLEIILDNAAILVNMISGWDIRFADYRRLRHIYPGTIALDVHSLLLGREGDGRRFFRYNPEVIQWIREADIIQLNEPEFRSIAQNQSDLQFFQQNSCFKEQNILNLTRSHHGSTTVYQEGRHVLRLDQTPPGQIDVVDPIGCGDAFMAGFLIEYLKSQDIHEAAKCANRIAALTGTFRGLPDPVLLQQKLREFSCKQY